MDNNRRRKIVYYTCHGKETTFSAQRNGVAENEEAKLPSVSVSKESIRPRAPRPPTVPKPRRQAVDNGSYLPYDRAGLYARKGMFPDIKDEHGYPGRRPFKTRKNEDLINLDVVIPGQASYIKREEGDYRNLQSIDESSPDEDKLFPQLVYGEDMSVTGKKYDIPTQLPAIVNGLAPHVQTKKRVPTPQPFINASVADLRLYMRCSKPAPMSPPYQADISNSSSLQSQTTDSTATISDGCTIQIPSQISIITPEPPKTKRPAKTRPVPKGRLPPLSEEQMSCRNTSKSKRKH